jgi:hypothetical protein
VGDAFKRAGLLIGVIACAGQGECLFAVILSFGGLPNRANGLAEARNSQDPWIGVSGDLLITS